MTVELSNLRREGASVLVDARVREGKGSRSYPVTLRRVGAIVQPSLAAAVPNELMAEIFAAARAFVETNEAVGRLLTDRDLPAG